MIERISALSPDVIRSFDVVFDVRTPDEFGEDHIPGAENLPVLSNAERAEIGEIYVRRSKFEARRRGAALIARNIADHLLTRFADAPGGLRPLIYCWRGGQRSNALALILAEVGWRVAVVEGGYRTYRRIVSQRLYGERPPWSFVRLSGGTGAGKTELLARLRSRGGQVLDLEEAARHRGSLFGGLGEPQPSQKLFESRVLARLDELDWQRTILVEDESSRIGDRFLPPALFAALKEAPRIEIKAPLAARAGYVARVYADVGADADRLEQAIAALPRNHSQESKNRWAEFVRTGRVAEAAFELIAAHYDPAYLKADADKPPPFAELVLNDLSAASLDRAADRLEEILKGPLRAGAG